MSDPWDIGFEGKDFGYEADELPMPPIPDYDADRERIFKYLEESIPELGPYVFNRSITTSSMYVKFKDDRLRSLRIGDHNGKEKYRYKWNLRKDIKRSYQEVDRGVRRFYFSWKEIDEFCEYIRAEWKLLCMDENIRRKKNEKDDDCSSSDCTRK